MRAANIIHCLSRTRALTHSLARSLTHSLTHSLTTHPPTRSPTHPPAHPLIHPLTHSLTRSLSQSLAHSRTLSLTEPILNRLPTKVHRWEMPQRYQDDAVPQASSAVSKIALPATGVRECIYLSSDVQDVGNPRARWSSVLSALSQSAPQDAQRKLIEPTGLPKLLLRFTFSVS
jgi:hypothetical protein